jgi:hypothetical protein
MKKEFNHKVPSLLQLTPKNVLMETRQSNMHFMKGNYN